MAVQARSPKPVVYFEGPRPPMGIWVAAVMELVRRDLKVRYKNSSLGVFWSFLNPAMQVVILTIVFKVIMGSTVKNFSVELFTCMLPWMFFAQALPDGAICVAKDIMLVHKYAFPRVILPAACVASNLVHLLLGFSVLAILFEVLRVHVTVAVLWVVPLLAIQCMLMLGITLLFATLNMYYSDIKFLLTSGVQLLFFLSPIVYTIDQVQHSTRLPGVWKEVYMMANPLTPLFIGYRAALLHGGEWPVEGFFGYVGISLAWSLVFLGLGLIIWRRHSWRFAETG